MRVDVTEWSRIEDRNSVVEWKAVTVRTYLTAGEVTRCALHDYTTAQKDGLFLLRFDVRYLRDDAMPPLRLLAAQIVAEITRQEHDRTQAEASAARPFVTGEPEYE